MARPPVELRSIILRTLPPRRRSICLRGCAKVLLGEVILKALLKPTLTHTPERRCGALALADYLVFWSWFVFLCFVGASAPVLLLAPVLALIAKPELGPMTSP